MCAGTVFFQDTDVAAAERNGFETAEDPRRDALGVNIAQGAGIHVGGDQRAPAGIQPLIDTIEKPAYRE